MDASQKDDNFKKLVQLTQYGYACFLIRELPQEVKFQYPACSAVPNQSAYKCVTDPTFDPYTLLLYIKTLYRVKLCEVEDVCQQARKHLDMGINSKDFKFLIKRCVTKWFNSDFGTIEDDLAVQPDVVEAVAQAFEKHEQVTRYRQFKAIVV